MNRYLWIAVTFCWMVSLFGKTYDCFLFFNEWEVLEIRLNELDDVVDQFVIVEANESFRGLPKPFNFEKKRELYSKFEDKITYIKIDKHFKTKNPWERRAFQFNKVLKGLRKCKKNDVIILSDLDEIPDSNIIKSFKSARYSSSNCLSLRQTMYRFFLNRRVPRGSLGQPWIGPAIVHYSFLKDKSPEEVRNLSRAGKFPIINGGWHFTSMGGFERMFEKYENFCDWKNPHCMSHEEWRKLVDSYDFAPIDKTYPRFVQENIDYLIESGLIDY